MSAPTRRPSPGPRRIALPEPPPPTPLSEPPTTAGGAPRRLLAPAPRRLTAVSSRPPTRPRAAPNAHPHARPRLAVHGRAGANPLDAPPIRVQRRVTRLPLRGRSVRAGSVRSLQAWLRPGWPLKYLLIGFPLWWALGLSTLIFPLMAVPMAVELVRTRRSRRITVPPAFWLWAAFLAWQVIGLLLLSISPPGTHAGSVGGRLISIALSGVEYAGVTVTLLYAGNLGRAQVPAAAIARWMGAFFLTVAAGGALGIAAPRFSFRSAIELVLPRHIATQKFVSSLVHPVAAQVQDVIGVGNGRPAAPFGYTNSWGNALSILIVWFVAAYVLPTHGWRRLAAAAIVALSVVPIVFSLNRGLWIGVGVTVLWLVGRQLLQGRIGVVLVVVATTALGAVIAAFSPLAGVVTARLNHGVSDNIRVFVAHMSVVAIQHSPIVGYGGARHSNGSASSIAIGPTTKCPACGSVATGSTGQLWSVLFNNGVVGALLYFGFFAAVIVTCWRLRGPVNEAALVSIALSFVYMFFYSAIPVAPTLTMVAVAVLWRERAAQDDASTRPAPSPRSAGAGT